MTSNPARRRSSFRVVLPTLVGLVLGLVVAVVPPAFAGTVSFQTSSHSFGSVRLGLTSQASLVLTNTGTSTQVTSIVMIGGNSSEFVTEGSGCGGVPLVLANGESCVLTVHFQPSSLGSRTTTLQVHSDSETVPTVSLPMSGTGVAPTADLSTGALDFGAIALGAASVAQTVTLSNDGSADLTVGAVEVAGDNGDFATGGGCDGTVVPAGEACQVAVTFTPATFGPRAATLTINTDGGNPTVELDGTGVDLTDPTVTLSNPTAPFTLASSTVLNFTGQDPDPGSGVASFDLRKRTAPWNGSFGAWEQPASWSGLVAESRSVGLSVGRTTCFSARSRDGFGNPSPWSPGRCTARPLGDRSLSTSTGWTRTTGASYYLGTATRSSAKGATLTRTSARLSRVALVVTKCATCGSVGVYVGSTLIGKVSLVRATKASRVLVVLPAFSLRSGTVTIKVLTSGKPVLIEGLGIFRSS